MKKLVSLILTLCIAFSLASANALDAGTYTATGKGNNGDVTVEVTLSDSAITDVKIVAHAETAGLADPALEKIPAAIVAHNTLAVDTVSGATNTSAAIVAAVEDAIKQAGGDLETFQVPVEKSPVEMKKVELQADVIVVGGGISGLSAALGAVDEGVEVILFEKTASFGSFGMAAGHFAVVGSQSEIDAGYDVSVESALGRLQLNNEADGKQSGYPDYDKLTCILENSSGNVQWLKSQGLNLGGVMAPGAELARLQTVTSEGEIKNGAYAAERLYTTMGEKGVTTYMETPVTELIVENGKVTGVVAQSSDTIYRAYAKGGVVLCCGGFGHDKERMAAEVPEYANAMCLAAVGDTGDGFAMAEAAGAKFYDNPWVAAATPVVSMNVPDSAAISYTAGVMVNKEGKRLVSETAHYSLVCNTLAWNPDALFLYDSSLDARNAALESAVSVNEAFKGETIEELAAAAGIDAAGLAATVETFNAYCAAGEDPEFGKLELAAIEKGPFYAVKMIPSYIGTLGGVVTTEKGEVLSTSDEVIPGLFAAGEMSNRPYYNYGYISAASLQFYSHLGHVAGMNAALNAK